MTTLYIVWLCGFAGTACLLAWIIPTVMKGIQDSGTEINTPSFKKAELIVWVLALAFSLLWFITVPVATMVAKTEKK